VSERTVIVGGGIAGLVAALLLSERIPGRDIYVVEQGDEPGGLLRAFDYGQFGRFDYGMHTITGTHVPELDERLYRLLPEDEWEVLAGVRRDISGAFFRGRLQTNGPAPDLRDLPPDEYRAALGDFFAALQSPPGAPGDGFRGHAAARFGELISTRYLAPIVEKVYGHSADQVHQAAGLLLPLDRVALFDERVFAEMLPSPLLRARIAYPEQRHLPLEYASGRGSYYPKRYGVYRVVEALARRLAAAGVTLLTATDLTRVCRRGGEIVAVTLRDRRGQRDVELDDLARLYWTVGPLALPRLLGLDVSDVRLDRPKRTVVCNLVIDRPLAVDDLYYFYCLDPPHQTYRVTNYRAYCSGAERAGGYPVSVELLVDPAGSPDERAWEAQAISELREFGALAAGTEILFKRAQALQTGFPMLTRRNVEGLEEIRSRLRATGVENLTLTGIMSEPGLFFQSDVLADTFRKVEAGG
jgi:phytoene dehydrogenase-like protein